MITDAVSANFTVEELAILGNERVLGAIQAALIQYSTPHPLELVETCAVDGAGVVTLPPAWVEGWSNVVSIGYPVINQLLDAQSDGATIEFTADDWVLEAGQYALALVHNLESVNVITQFWEGTTQASVDSVSVISSNQIKAYIPAIPDRRFAGLAQIERV